MKKFIENILKGLTSGILSFYIIIYALRPAVPYPELILEIFENKWLILILLLINYYLYIWDNISGVLLLLSILSLIFDYIVFTEKGFKKKKYIEKFYNNETSYINTTTKQILPKEEFTLTSSQSANQKPTTPTTPISPPTSPTSPITPIAPPTSPITPTTPIAPPTSPTSPSLSQTPPSKNIIDELISMKNINFDSKKIKLDDPSSIF